MRAAAVGLGAALLLTGCSTTPAPAEEPAPDLAVTVLQQRVDATTRTVGVKVTNRTDTLEPAAGQPHRRHVKALLR